MNQPNITKTVQGEGVNLVLAFADGIKVHQTGMSLTKEERKVFDAAIPRGRNKNNLARHMFTYTSNGGFGVLCVVQDSGELAVLYAKGEDRRVLSEFINEIESHNGCVVQFCIVATDALRVEMRRTQ